jgi:hypothetical protein
VGTLSLSTWDNSVEDEDEDNTVFVRMPRKLYNIQLISFLHGQPQESLLSAVAQEHETPVVATGNTLFVHNRQKKKKISFGAD